MKKQFEVSYHINPDIKVGDIVRVWDGSALTSPEYPDKDFAIIYPYKDETGKEHSLKNLDAEVIAVGVKSNATILQHPNIVYFQDITIRIGNCTFNTCSNFVRKVF